MPPRLRNAPTALRALRLSNALAWYGHGLLIRWHTACLCRNFDKNYVSISFYRTHVRFSTEYTEFSTMRYVFADMWKPGFRSFYLGSVCPPRVCWGTRACGVVAHRACGRGALRRPGAALRRRFNCISSSSSSASRAACAKAQAARTCQTPYFVKENLLQIDFLKKIYSQKCSYYEKMQG